MTKDYTNKFILSALNLPIITDFNSFCNEIALSEQILYLLSKKTDCYYNKFFIKKSNGSKREILSPSYSLKLVQKWILAEILEKISSSEQSMAYKKGEKYGIKRNAEIHRYSIYILELDLKNFFPSIKRNTVFYLFRNLGYSIFVSNMLANLCTYDGYLPQGSVCSPYISNLICSKLDNRLNGLCSKKDVLYTRYADDLTFSCDNKVILHKIKSLIKKIIEDENFQLNTSKTRFLSPVSHKRVTGITINDSKIKANKILKKSVRAMIHQSIVTKNYSNNNIIRGYIAYINYIEEGYKEKTIQYITSLIKKPYCDSNDISKAYNSNRLFKELPCMSYQHE